MKKLSKTLAFGILTKNIRKKVHDPNESQDCKYAITLGVVGDDGETLSRMVILTDCNIYIGHKDNPMKVADFEKLPLSSLKHLIFCEDIFDDPESLLICLKNDTSTKISLKDCDGGAFIKKVVFF